MERLDLKILLISDTLIVFNKLKDFGANTPKSIVKMIQKNISKDLKAGLKIINKKVPVYIELPKYNSEGNGQYSLEKECSEQSDIKEIITTPVVLEDPLISIRQKRE